MYGRRPVVMVSENLAREMWGTPSAAIGKRMREFPSDPWYEVIGVVQDVRENGVQEKAPEIVYWSSLTECLIRSADDDVRNTQRPRGYANLSQRGAPGRVVGELEFAAGVGADHAGSV